MHVVGDVGNGHGDDEAAGVLLAGVGRRMHRIIVVARIHGIDGQKRQIAQVGALVEIERGQVGKLAQHRLGKLVAQAVRMDGDQADLPLVVRVAERFHDACFRHALAVRAQDVEANEIAIAGATASLPARTGQALELSPVDRLDHAPTMRVCAEDAELTPLLARQLLDR